MTVDLMCLREIGWTKWDPIELLRNRESWVGQRFQDEYDHYLVHVADRVVAGDDDNSLVSYLVAIERDNMGLGSTESSKQRAAATVSAIRNYLVGETEGAAKVYDDLKRVVEDAMPGWRVVVPEPRTALPRPRKEDSLASTNEALKAKWFGQGADGDAAEAAEPSHQVIVEPVGGGGPGRKTIIVRDGKIIGMQG
ncbi:hypothetical protein OIU34_24700 [Pararhizobium sp. BT-229]|uniref:hypothetical protein n=1 Tax=Pararhizobium sp. BT-229 TaxID=2986923 RepID=UPI0021F70045|nr:hypothetical protein [Pararhizobium sp. BT-229]MCV9965102.1 hypothetical protein [Pararhizobium sp. BT-229]